VDAQKAGVFSRLRNSRRKKARECGFLRVASMALQWRFNVATKIPSIKKAREMRAFMDWRFSSALAKKRE
jgi:hypothetical protein